MKNIYYRIGDGRIWDVEAAKYLADGESPPDGADVISLISAEGISDEAYLVRTLEFYGYPPGELALKSGAAIRAELERLDAIYLTPRTLAGIGANDPEAVARYNEHEEKAAPLRDALRKMEEA